MWPHSSRSVDSMQRPPGQSSKMCWKMMHRQVMCPDSSQLSHLSIGNAERRAAMKSKRYTILERLWCAGSQIAVQSQRAGPLGLPISSIHSNKGVDISGSQRIILLQVSISTNLAGVWNERVPYGRWQYCRSSSCRQSATKVAPQALN